MRAVISGYRYYSAELGRWIGRDPAEMGFSPYVFIDNDVLNDYDYLGLWKKDWDEFRNDSRAKGVLESGDNIAINAAYEAWLKEKESPGITDIYSNENIFPEAPPLTEKQKCLDICILDMLISNIIGQVAMDMMPFDIKYFQHNTGDSPEPYDSNFIDKTAAGSKVAWVGLKYAGSKMDNTSEYKDAKKKHESGKKRTERRKRIYEQNYKKQLAKYQWAKNIKIFGKMAGWTAIALISYDLYDDASECLCNCGYIGSDDSDTNEPLRTAVYIVYK